MVLVDFIACRDLKIIMVLHLLKIIPHLIIFILNVFYSDIDKACREVYKNNYGITPVEDVRKIIPEELEDFSILMWRISLSNFQ